MSRFIRLMSIGFLVALLAAAGLVAAQDDPATTIEALALRTYRQNLRSGGYTFWIGGDIGDSHDVPLRVPLGEQLERWQLAGLGDDDDLAPQDLTRPTLLNFWASWCSPCRAEFPHLVEVALAADDHAFDVVFVNMADSEDTALEFLAQYPAGITTVVDELERLATRTNVQSIPTSVLLDVDGTVLAAHAGIFTPTVTAFFDAVAAHPGVGVFVAADHPDMVLEADLLPFDVADAAEIEPGQNVTGTLTDDDFQHVFRFEGQAGTVADITLRADDSDLDAYLVLMTVDGERLEENDDASVGTDSAIQTVLPADGTYVVVATRFLEAEGLDTGAYVLRVELRAAETIGVQPEPQDFTLAYGDEVQDWVSGNDPRRFFLFEGQAGDEVRLQVTHALDDVALRIEVKDTHLQRLAVSDASVDGTATLDDLVLPEDGRYRITVYRPRSHDITPLEFTLTLTSIDASLETPALDVDLETPTPADGPETTLAYGDTVRGELNDTQFEQRWTFAGQRGDVVSVTMARELDEPGGLDGFMLLLGPDGETLREVDDFQGGVMPAVDHYELPADGVYTVVATRFGFANGFSTGAYTLTLTQGNGAQPDGAASDEGTGGGVRWVVPETLAAELRWTTYNSSNDGAITAGDFDDWYIFRGRAGDVVSLRMVADDAQLDPFLILMDAGGYELAQNDDEIAGSVDAGIVDFELPADDTYLVRVSRYGFANGPTEGHYTFVVESEAEPLSYSGDALASTPLAYGDVAESALSHDHVGERYTFEGQADEAVTVSVRRISGDLDPVLTLRDADGQELATNHVWQQNDEARINHLVLPEDGTYTVEVMLDDLATSGAYRLLLLAGPALAVDPGAFVPAEGLDIELVLIWGSGADLDLRVVPPAIMNTMQAASETTARANDFCEDVRPAPVERIIWPKGIAPTGTYRIEVVYQFDCEVSRAPVPFMLAVVQNGEIVTLAGSSLLREGDTYTTFLDR